MKLAKKIKKQQIRKKKCKIIDEIEKQIKQQKYVNQEEIEIESQTQINQQDFQNLLNKTNEQEQQKQTINENISQYHIFELSQLQFRDITPNDFEILQYLDGQNQKGMTQQQINKIKFYQVTKQHQLDYGCVFCKDEMKIGQMVKELQCKHIYHKRCLDQWLTNKQKCPCCNIDL